ncbi:uncharacterized protein LOC143194147 [Rhynchophorus ferrugineus]|uniref:Uncharacterized protein n=1 Tax=Rhynchophorus ferrugineus TaxID=354439 RepID=A0A834HU68_RHYFE|nr:hypothetical protein GWI33_019306 [Rhynchophorus ferrugineus]
MSSKCIEDTGRELSSNNVDIVKYLCNIEEERATLEDIIQKQYQERKKIEMEIEKLTYKLCLINKSLSMRIKAKNNYDKTIEEIRSHYTQLVDNSNKLRQMVEKTQAELDDIMNKKTGTPAAGEDARNRTAEGDECPCAIEEPTKEICEKSSVNSQKNGDNAVSTRSTLDSIGEASVPENASRHSDPSATEMEVSTSQNDPHESKVTTASQSVEKNDSKTTKEDKTVPNISSQDSSENKRLTFNSERQPKGLTGNKLREMKGLKQSLVGENNGNTRQGSSTIKEKDLSSKQI